MSLDYEAAKAAHPERWNGRATRDWSLPEKVYLNPEQKVEITEINSGEVAKAASFTYLHHARLTFEWKSYIISM